MKKKMLPIYQMRRDVLDYLLANDVSRLSRQCSIMRDTNAGRKLRTIPVIYTEPDSNIPIDMNHPEVREELEEWRSALGVSGQVLQPHPSIPVPDSH